MAHLSCLGPTGESCGPAGTFWFGVMGWTRPTPGFSGASRFRGRTGRAERAGGLGSLLAMCVRAMLTKDRRFRRGGGLWGRASSRL